ncbi:MAG: ankyrin repeat domain-containing protein [Infirmifilum sp.]
MASRRRALATRDQPLYVVAIDGYLDVAKLLMDRGVSPNSRDGNGQARIVRV